jgi:hypothetical protein
LDTGAPSSNKTMVTRSIASCRKLVRLMARLSRRVRVNRGKHRLTCTG